MITLTPDAKGALKRWNASRTGNPYGEGFAAYAEHLIASLADLPSSLAHAMEGFRSRLGRAGALLFKAVPLPTDLPVTPVRPYPELREPTGTEAIVLAAVALIGNVVSFPDWHGGDRVQNIYPLRGQARAQNASNAVYLEMHTETAFRPDTPDLVALLCLRAGIRTETLICDGISAWRALPLSERRLLTRPVFGFDLPGGGRTPARPLVSQTPYGLRLNYAEAVRADDAEHQSALTTFHKAVRDHAIPIVLQTGDLLILDNTHLVHGRRAVEPRYDGTDRWLQRALGRAVPERAT